MLLVERCKDSMHFTIYIQNKYIHTHRYMYISIHTHDCTFSQHTVVGWAKRALDCALDWPGGHRYARIHQLPSDAIHAQKRV